MQFRYIVCFSVLIFAVFIAEAKAVSYGYSLIDPYQETPSSPIRIYAETGTVLDYGVWYYYDPGIQAFMYEGSNLIASTERIMNYEGPVVGAWIDLQANYGETYRIHGDHYLGAYHYYMSGGQPVFIDYFGFNRFLGNFPSPYSFTSGPTAYYYYVLLLTTTGFIK